MQFPDVRQFSKHMIADLESIFGFNDTFLETDLVFQNSFIPRSVDFNLTSRYLRHLGGSFQFGGRLENLEEVLQNIFGHEATTKTLTEFMLQALEKFQHIVAEAGADFISSHRETRSIGIADIKNILKKVKQEVITEIRGWMYWRAGGLERLFTHFKFDPFSIDWDEMLENWVDSILEDVYQSLINYELDITNSWAAVEEEVTLWSVIGMPLKISHQEGVLVSLEASSKIDLFSLITNPFSSTLNFGFKPR
ncbi:unnamed protein product [Meganyctiphanes norvegica]|uniref:Vitellinogen open beta-sheet domain-containing protein n=1 Tax=Meganyctiphanes norvegica TaxID=48144 RepID=A0AAV2SQ02_MEGNR